MAEMNRYAENRSLFVAEAVRAELERRRKDRLIQSLQHPHPESMEMADLGFREWVSLAAQDDAVLSEQRYPMLCVIPLTRTGVEGALYPTVQPGRSGLRNPSYALVDQLRSVDKHRVLGSAGSLTRGELESVDLGLRLYLGL